MSIFSKFKTQMYSTNLLSMKENFETKDYLIGIFLCVEASVKTGKNILCLELFNILLHSFTVIFRRSSHRKTSWYRRRCEHHNYHNANTYTVNCDYNVDVWVILLFCLGFAIHAPLVFHFGYITPGANSKLYNVLTSQTASVVKERFEKNNEGEKIVAYTVRTV